MNRRSTWARYENTTGPVADRTLPEEVVVPTTLPAPVALPPTLSELQRGTVDVNYSLGVAPVAPSVVLARNAIASTTSTLDADANPDLDRGQVLLMGYLYRPYTANTVWLRLMYRW